MQGRENSTISLPQGRPPTRIPHSIQSCLTDHEAALIYQCVDSEQVVSPILFYKGIVHPPVESVEAYRVLEAILEEEGPNNPYEQLLLYQPEEEDPSQYLYSCMDQYLPGSKLPNNQNMEQWSILGTNITYPQSSYDNSLVFLQEAPNEAVQSWSKQPNCPSVQNSKPPTDPVIQEYLDCYDEVNNTLKLANTYNDNTDVATTYLGTDKIYKTDRFVPEISVPIYSNSHTWGQIVGGPMVDTLIDTGASKCYMSKQFYLKHKCLHNLPKYKSKIVKLRVGNGQKVTAHFVVPIVLRIQQHRFEIFALVSDIQNSLDLVIGMKNLHELEAEHSSRHSELRFLNRAVPMFPFENFSLKPGQKRFIKFVVPFFQTLNGKAIIKLNIGPHVYTLQCKLFNNLGVFDLVNTSKLTMFFNESTAFGIVDIRSLGYYNIRHKTLQYNLSLQPDVCNYIRAVKARQLPSQAPKQTCKQHVKTTSADQDKYPWLDPEDPRRNMSDEEILDTYIDLSNSCLSHSQKEDLMRIIKENKKAFSLRDEIGHCPNIKIDIDVIDESPFFVRPFPISEDDKPIMDWQMQRLVSLGTLSRNTTSHTSPVMLITRKVTKDKRPVVDFRLLNTRIRRHNTATPLLRDIYQMLGKSQCEVLSCVDLKDAFHSLKLTDKAKDYCGILPYFGSPHYRYERMPMGLSISPCKWIQYIGVVMEGMSQPHNYIAIMDDLLVHSLKKTHLKRITDLLKALISHGLKLSPKKCQFFMEELVYMGNVFKIGRSGISISPIKTRVEAIQKTPPPKTPKQCKSFCGVVNYLSIFCPHLQKLLAPIYDLTRKGRPFVWTETHQHNFELIKKQLASAPVLSLPNGVGRYILYSDTSKTHTGSALWQIQHGSPRLIGYASKSLPSACVNYSITELEMTGLLYNMNIWKYYLGKKDFDAAVDHAAIPHIMKSKNLPATDRIVRLLEALSFYSFHLYYVKGKDMILCDFLSRIQVDDGDPMDLIPITYNIMDVLEEVYNRIVDKYFVMTRAQRALSGQAPPPKVHGATKGVDPHVKPEVQAKRNTFQSPRTSERKILSSLARTPGSVSSPSTPFVTPPSTLKESPLISTHKSVKAKPTGSATIGSNEQSSARPKLDNHTPVPRLTFDEDPPARDQRSAAYKPQQVNLSLTPSGVMMNKQISTPSNIQPPHISDLEPGVDLDPNLEIPFSETSVEAMFRPPEMQDFSLPPTLGEYVKGKDLVSKNMPRQVEIDRLLKQINRKILRETRLPSSMKDLEAAYNCSSAFRSVYQYLKYNKLPPNRRLSVQVQTQAKDYFLLGCLLFKQIYHKDKLPDSVLCVPPSKMDNLLDYYHSTLIGGHQGITKTLHTLSSRFYCPRMADFIRAYIVGCHICQLYRNSKRFNNQFQYRAYDISTPALTNVSMDIKYMPTSSKRYKFLLVLLCEVSNFIVTHPMSEISSTHVCTILVDNFISYFSTPVRIICDQDPSFLSSLTQYCFQQYGIKLVTVSPTNHRSLLAEHGIKSLSNLIMKHLSGFGKNWHLFAKPCMIAYNSYASPNLAGYSPFELVMGRKAHIAPILEVTPPIPVTGTYAQAKAILDKKLQYFREMLRKFRDKRYEVLSKNKEFQGYTSGQIVYLFFPGHSLLHTGNKKFTCKFVGPLAIWKCFSPTQFVLMSLDGVIYPYLVEASRIKPGVIRTTKGNVHTLPALKQIIKSGYLLKGSDAV